MVLVGAQPSFGSVWGIKMLIDIRQLQINRVDFTGAACVVLRPVGQAGQANNEQQSSGEQT